jgi:hypothetical protein
MARVSQFQSRRGLYSVSRYLNQEDRLEANKSTGFKEMDKNIELAEEILQAFQFVHSEDKGVVGKTTAENSQARLKQLEYEQRKEFVYSSTAMEKRIRGMMEQNENDKRAAKTGKLFGKVV